MRHLKYKRWIWLTALLLTVALLTTTAKLLWHEWQSRIPNFHDDFARNRSGLTAESGWQAFGGTWQTGNGELRNIADDRGAKLLNGNSHWQNYLIEADVMLLGETGDAGFVARTQDEETGVDAYHGYFAGLRDLDDTLILGRADFGWHEFRNTPFRPRVKTGTWYHLRFVVYQCTLAVSAQGDASQYASVSVHDPDCIHSGRFGLQSYSTAAKWRNLSVRPASLSDLQAVAGPEPITDPGRYYGKPGIVDLGAFQRATEPIWRELRGHHANPNATQIADLRLMAPDHPAEVTIHGVVTLVSPLLFVQDSTGGLAIANAQSERPLQIGDAVEATGEAEVNNFSSVLHKAVVRPLWSHASAPPLSVSASQASTGAYDALYIETEAILTSAHNDGTHLMLRLHEGSQEFAALAENSSYASNAHAWQPGSRIRLRGICVTNSNYTHDEIPFALLLRSAEDVQLVAAPPWWSTGHIIELVVVLLLLSFGAQLLYASSKRARLRAVIEERERLAHEMHDTLAQSFAGLGFQLQALAQDAAPGSAMRAQLESSIDLVRFGHNEARRNIAALRPGKLDQLGLFRALEEAANKMLHGGSVKLLCSERGIAPEIPLRFADPLFRIGQEAIANAVRHAHPERIDIRAVYGRSQIKLSIRDNGSGFDLQHTHAGFGLRGMQRRADTIGAHLIIRSLPEHGTSISVRVRLPKRRLASWWHHDSTHTA